MNAKLFLLACLLPLVLVLADDACETNSYAVPAVNRISALSASTFSGLTTASEINAALNALLNIAQTTTSPFLQNIYVGQNSTDDFYMIKNCLNQQGTNNYCSSNSAQYFAYVRNFVYLGDEFRHVYAVSGSTIDITDEVTAETPESSTYDTRNKVWFNATAGHAAWTPVIPYSSGGSGKSYVKAFGTDLDAVADRTSAEYCGTCLSDSYAVAVTQGLAVTDLSSAFGVTSQNGFTAIATAIKGVMDAVDSSDSVNGLIGFPNGDSYMVKYCKEQGGLGVAECSGHDFLFYVTNTAVFSDSVRRAFALASDGTVGDKVTDLAAYVVTGRSWYQTGNGWSDTYAFATGNTMGRTFVTTINGAVVGTDYSENEPCTRASSAATVLASIVFVVVPLFAMLF